MHNTFMIATVGAYIQLLLQTFQGLWYFVHVLRVVLFLGLITQESHGEQRWLKRNRVLIKKKKTANTVNGVF